MADVIDTILDKGLVIDAYIRVSVVDIELLTIDARIVIASVDTHLRFAEAVNRLDIAHQDEKMGLPELVRKTWAGRGITTVAKSKTRCAIEQADKSLREFVGGDEQRRGSARRVRREEDR